MKFGPHSPNRRLSDEGVRETLRKEIQASGATAIKLLAPDHSRADAIWAKQQGLQVVVRAPGEGSPHVADVRAIITEFAGVCDFLEVGNEPYKTEQYPDMELAFWVHAWHMEAIWRECAPLAHAAGMNLCTPGWHGNDEPWQPRGQDGRLVALSPPLIDRLREVYGEYDAIGVHAYGLYNLEALQVQRLQRWAMLWPDKPLLLTEVGIAANDLLGVPPNPARYAASRVLKGRRIGIFLAEAAEQIPQLECATVFISDSALEGWLYFEPANPGEYVPDGALGYGLGDHGWLALGRAIRERRAA